MRRCVPVAVALMLMVPLGAAHAQSDEEKSAARSLATQGAEAFTAGKFDETVDLLTRAEALVHAPTHLLLIARAQSRLGRYVAAKETYLKISREELASTAPAAFKKAQQDAKDELAAIDPKIASVRIVIEGAGSRKVTLKLDDQPVSEALIGVHRPIDPGKHLIMGYPVGLKPIEVPISLGEGEKKDVKVVIPSGPLPTGIPLSNIDNPDAANPDQAGTPTEGATGGGSNKGLIIGGIAAGAVGAGGVVVGVLFTLKGSSTQTDADDAFAACNGTCSGEQKSTVEGLDSDAASQKTIGIIGLIGGGVLVAGGVTLLVLGLTSKSEAPPKSAWIAPYATPNQLGVFGAF